MGVGTKIQILLMPLTTLLLPLTKCTMRDRKGKPIMKLRTESLSHALPGGQEVPVPRVRRADGLKPTTRLKAQSHRLPRLRTRPILLPGRREALLLGPCCSWGM